MYDAELSKTLPVGLSVASGLNGMAHCVDSLWAPRTDPINQALAWKAPARFPWRCAGSWPMRRTWKPASRRSTALPGRRVLRRAGSGLHHKICHVLGGTFDLPHAQTHATVLPYVLALNAPRRRNLAGRLAAALGAQGTAGDPAAAAISALAELYSAVDAPFRLADFGFAEEGIPEAVQRIVKAAPASNPVPVNAQNMTELLTAALAGDRPRASVAA